MSGFSIVKKPFFRNAASILFDFCCPYYLWRSKGTKNIWHLQIFVQKSFTAPLQFSFLRVRLTILGSPTQTNVVFVVGCSAEARVAFMTPSVIWCDRVADAQVIPLCQCSFLTLFPVPWVALFFCTICSCARMYYIVFVSFCFRFCHSEKRTAPLLFLKWCK